MDYTGARQVLETTNWETANEYLRFGWKLINQRRIPATPEQPEMVSYVLGSFRVISDTRQLVVLEDVELVNQYLQLGWRLIDEYLTQAADSERRHETPHYVLAWQQDDVPMKPGQTSAAPMAADGAEIELGDIIE
jgi:hypothetical protein